MIVSTALLWLVTMLGGFSVAVFLFPAALLALVSVVACGLGRDAVRPAPAP